MRGQVWRADGFHERRILGALCVRSRVDILPFCVMSAQHWVERRGSIPAVPRPLQPIDGRCRGQTTPCNGGVLFLMP
jgi:hypothetical protein